MVPPNKRQKAGALNFAKRKDNALETMFEENNSNSSTCAQINQLSFDDSNHSFNLTLNHGKNVSNNISIGTQTIDPYSKFKSSTEDFDFEKISDLCCIFIDSLTSWTSINNR